MITRVAIIVEVHGAPDDVWKVVERALDDGAIQNAINEHETDAGPLRVLSVEAKSAREGAA
jgi:hypothetical protein